MAVGRWAANLRTCPPPLVQVGLRLCLLLSQTLAGKASPTPRTGISTHQLVRGEERIKTAAISFVFTLSLAVANSLLQKFDITVLPIFVLIKSKVEVAKVRGAKTAKLEKVIESLKI